MKTIIYFFLLIFIVNCNSKAQEKVRARDLGILFDGKPGILNAITDVSGVEVGHVTINIRFRRFKGR